MGSVSDTNSVGADTQGHWRTSADAGRRDPCAWAGLHDGLSLSITEYTELTDCSVGFCRQSAMGVPFKQSKSRSLASLGMTKSERSVAPSRCLHDGLAERKDLWSTVSETPPVLTYVRPTAVAPASR